MRWTPAARSASAISSNAAVGPRRAETRPRGSGRRAPRGRRRRGCGRGRRDAPAVSSVVRKRASGPKASSAAADDDELERRGGPQVLLGVAGVEHAPALEAPHLDPPESRGESRPLTRSVDRAGAAAGRRLRGEAGAEPSRNDAARGSASRDCRAAAGHDAPHFLGERLGRRPQSRPVVGTAGWITQAHRPGRRVARPRGTTRFTPPERDGHHGHARLQGQHEAAPLERPHPRVRAARPLREDDDARPGRGCAGPRRAGSCARGRGSRGRSPTWPAARSAQPEARHRGRASACG